MLQTISNHDNLPVEYKVGIPPQALNEPTAKVQKTVELYKGNTGGRKRILDFRLISKDTHLTNSIQFIPWTSKKGSSGWGFKRVGRPGNLKLVLQGKIFPKFSGKERGSPKGKFFEFPFFRVEKALG